MYALEVARVRNDTGYPVEDETIRIHNTVSYLLFYIEGTANILDKCGACSGDGWITVPDHSNNCSISEGCASDCPHAVQEQCKDCDGFGRVESPEQCLQS